MNAYHYECSNCATGFVGVSLLYCPFCGSLLQQQGLVQCFVRDYVVTGWNTIAFRSTESGFVVRNVQGRSQL